MTIHPARYSTRSLSLLMVAAFAGIAVWLLAPWDGWGARTGGDAALPSSLRVDGTVDVTTTDGVVTRLVVPLALRGEDGLRIATDGARLRAETELSESAAAAVPATFTLTWLDGNGDDTLDPGEHAVLTADLPERSSVRPGNPLDLVIKPADGSSLVIEDVLR